MKLRRPTFRLIVYVIAMGVAVYLGWWWLGSRQVHQKLERMVAQCDRVMIESWAKDVRARRKFVDTFEVKGAEKIAALVSAIDVAVKKPACKCTGNPRLKFFRGPDEAGKLGIAHGSRIKFFDGGGEYELTASSREAVFGWFRDQGYDAIDEASKGEIFINADPEE